jgi:beta-N-acetylhexosaminidase
VPSRLLLAVVAAALGLALVATFPGGGERVVDVVTVRPDATSTAAEAPAATTITTGYAGADPASWTLRRLAAQLVFSCVDLSDLGEHGAARRQAAAGIGGITLLGSHPPRHLRARLAGVRRSAPTAVLPFVASDEEGGTVQRLRDVIYRLPSADTMGGWRPARVRRTAHAYALRMRRLGVRMDLAPVADLAVPGAYIDSLGRAFSGDPDAVTARVRAWRLGMRDAGVVTVLKHWPGHGSASNSHTGPARVAPLAELEERDLLPFNRELADGAPVVMVGHLLSRGLTVDGLPTSLSRRALHYLRRSAGPDTVLLTDSLAMAAASSSLGISPVRASVRALRAGADWAMACDAQPLRAAAAVRQALADGTIPRDQANASARRILALKARWGLAPRG